MASQLRRGTLGIVVVGVLLTGCSSSPSGVSAQTYMKTTCAAVVTWLQSIQGQVQTFKTQEASASSLPQARDELAGLMSEAVHDTDAMTAKIKAVGAPGVDGGKAVHAKLLAAFAQLRGVLSSAETKARQLPVDDPNAFKQGAAQIGTEINSQFSSVQSSFSKFGSNTALDAAAAADPNCQKLNSSTP